MKDATNLPDRLPTALCSYLRAHSGMTLTRGQLCSEVWQAAHFRASRTVDQTISVVRKELPAGERIVTVFRVGYRHEFVNRSHEGTSGSREAAGAHRTSVASPPT